MTTVLPPAYGFSDQCPIAWPNATPLMLDYPLIPQETESSSAFVHRVYIEALWLPESIMTLSHLVQSLRRVKESTTQQAPGESLRELLRPLLLSLQSVEKKYQEHLPTLLQDPQAAMERDTIDAEESAMWYAWHHGRPPARQFPDPDNVDEEKWKKRWMIDMERREVLVQIILHLIYLSLLPSLTESNTPPDRSRKRKRKPLRDSPVKRRKSGKRVRSPSPPVFSAQDNLDSLTDRLALWQAIEEDSEKYLKRPGDNDRDWMRVFFEDEVVPAFREQLPDLVKQFEAKIIPPTAEDISDDEDEVPVPKVEIKPKSKAPVRKPTLTEVDLAEITRNKPKQPSNSQASSRARSTSAERVDRRSRSRSVSLAAEEMKSLGGKRGGIVGNSKLFASEVDMRKQASTMKRIQSATSLLSLGGESKKVETTSKGLKARPSPTTLVSGTPPRPPSRTGWTGAESDDDIVPESPELDHLGTKQARDVVVETPIKLRRGTKR